MSNLDIHIPKISTTFTILEFSENCYMSFVFTMATGHAATEVQVRCFAIKGGALPAGVSIAGAISPPSKVIASNAMAGVRFARRVRAAGLGWRAITDLQA